uniref:Uncharacterized protein n=1 Tax=Paracidobacterium acidisoli TaxID=2303751 RepID=A0A372IK01_9BACT
MIASGGNAAEGWQRLGVIDPMSERTDMGSPAQCLIKSLPAEEGTGAKARLFLLPFGTAEAVP